MHVAPVVNSWNMLMCVCVCVCVCVSFAQVELCHYQGGRTRSNARWALTFQFTFSVLCTAYFVYLSRLSYIGSRRTSFGLGSEPIICTVGISSRRRPRYHIPPVWRRLLEKRHGKIGGPRIFVTTFLHLQSLRCMQDASG